MKKKVLFILHIPPPVHGAAMVGKIIMDSEAINSRFDTDYINLSTSSSLSEIGEKGIRKAVNILNVKRNVIKALLNKKYDLCYVTINSAGIGFLKDLLIVTILKAFNKKIIYHFHNKGVKKEKESLFYSMTFRFAFNNTKSILLSPALYPYFQNFLKQQNTFYCANGIPASDASMSLTKDYHANSKCKLLFLSNVTAEKGALVLLEACKLLKIKNIEFECHLVGAWSTISETFFSEMVRNYGLTQEVFGHGAKYNEEKESYFMTSDIFVLPTLNDCFPLVLLEAMSYGMPVVASAEGGIPDIVLDHETGFLVASNDAQALAAKLELLIKAPEMRQAFGEAAKRRFLNKFTVTKFEENFINILETRIQN